MVIQVDRAELEAVASDINAWGEELKSFVIDSATQRLARVQGMNFQGQAREAYVTSFEEMKGQITTQIESITDGQIAGIGERLKKIGVTMEEVDQSLAQY
jgi:uncharacterized protein YukE